MYNITRIGKLLTKFDYIDVWFYICKRVLFTVDICEGILIPVLCFYSSVTECDVCVCYFRIDHLIESKNLCDMINPNQP